MSYATLDYLLRLTAIWGLLWAYHFVFLRRSAFGWQRAYLLLALVLGPLIPLLPGVGEELPLRVPSLTVYVGNRVVESAVLPGIEAVSKPVWPSVVLAVYGLGVLFIWARSLVQWGRMRSYGLEGQTSSFRSYAVVRHAGVRGPYAAFGRIFLPRSLDDGLLTTALIHEAAHLRARHHYDTLFLTVLAGLCWFHPLFWLLRRALSTVHEFQADAATVREVPLRTYGHQLLKSTLRPGLALGLHASPLKTRIAMLTHLQKPRTSIFSYLGALLLLTALFLSCTDEMMLSDAGADNEKSEAVAIGDDKLLRHIYGTLTYPEAARVAGMEQRVYLRFKTNAEGKAEEIRVGFPPFVSIDLEEATEIVVVGITPEGGKADPPPADFDPVDAGARARLFSDEISRIAGDLVIEGLGRFYPAGEAAYLEREILFTFKLE